MRLLPCAFLLLISAGCYREYIIRDPLTAEEIIALTKSGSSSEDIIEKIDESRTIYILDTEDILNLDKRGVHHRVIEHMRQTREREIERRQRYHHCHYGCGHYYPFDYPYWYPYVGFGFGGAYCW